MANQDRFRPPDYLCLLIVLVLAAGTRVWFLNTCAHHGTRPGAIQVQDADQSTLDILIQNIHEDKGYTSTASANGTLTPSAHPAPLYPWLLAQLRHATSSLPEMYELVRWLQAGLGTLTVALLFLFARKALGGLPVAALAGLLAALHPFWIINTAEIGDGVLATFLLAACLAFGTLSLQDGMIVSWLFG